MRISTLSFVVGNQACNAKCPFCVSRMTGFDEVRGKKMLRVYQEAPTSLPNFESAVNLAKIAQVTTVLLTGKGEPTLAPAEITLYLSKLLEYKFPFIELQTNGLTFGRAFRDQEKNKKDFTYWFGLLREWKSLGLNTIALSVVSTSDQENASIYHPDYPSLALTVQTLHQLGFTVRLSLMLVKDLVDDIGDLEKTVAWCKEQKVEQLTIRPIRKPQGTKDQEVSDFVSDRGLEKIDEEFITSYIRSRGTKILSLSHGAEIYDLEGQNICLTDCLTIPDQPDQIRTLIYYSNGRLAYDWQYPGAVLLGGQGNAD